MGFKLRFEKPFIKDNTERTTKAEADILLNAQKIALKVEKQTFNALENSVEDQWAELAVQAMLISNKVSSTDFNGSTIASLINQTANEVKIQANKITLEGLITANGYFKVLPDGSIEAVNAKLSGAITATKMVAVSSDDYFGEVGISDGIVGLGLYDKRYSTQPYMKIGEVATGTGFALYDRNNVQRLIASAAQTTLRDQNDKTLLYTEGINRFLMAPNGTTYINVTNVGVQIVKNGVVLAQWGY